MLRPVPQLSLKHIMLKNAKQHRVEDKSNRRLGTRPTKLDCSVSKKKTMFKIYRSPFTPPRKQSPQETSVPLPLFVLRRVYLSYFSLAQPCRG